MNYIDKGRDKANINEASVVINGVRKKKNEKLYNSLENSWFKNPVVAINIFVFDSLHNFLFNIRNSSCFEIKFYNIFTFLTIDTK